MNQDPGYSSKKNPGYFDGFVEKGVETNLPYSVDEIYEISGSKNKKFRPVYKGTKRIYDHFPVRKINQRKEAGSKAGSYR